MKSLAWCKNQLVFRSIFNVSDYFSSKVSIYLVLQKAFTVVWEYNRKTVFDCIIIVITLKGVLRLGKN